MSTSTHPQQHAGLATSVLRHLSLMARRSGGRSPIRLTLQKQMQGTGYPGTWCFKTRRPTMSRISRRRIICWFGRITQELDTLISPRSGGRSPISSRRLDGDSLIPSQLALDEGSPRQVPLGQSASRVRFSLGRGPLHRCRCGLKPPAAYFRTYPRVCEEHAVDRRIWWTEATHRILRTYPKVCEEHAVVLPPFRGTDHIMHDVGA